MEFEPVINQKDVGNTLAKKRGQWDKDVEPWNDAWRQAADRRFAVCQHIIDSLASYHAQLLDGIDVDLTAPTRWTAIFESTARCLGGRQHAQALSTLPEMAESSTRQESRRGVA